jgi:hypothetical protein
MAIQHRLLDYACCEILVSLLAHETHSSPPPLALFPRHREGEPVRLYVGNLNFRTGSADLQE